MTSGAAEEGKAWVERKEQIGAWDSAWPLRTSECNASRGCRPPLPLARISHRRGDEVLLGHTRCGSGSSRFFPCPMSAAHEPLGVCLSLPDGAWISTPSQNFDAEVDSESFAEICHVDNLIG